MSRFYGTLQGSRGEATRQGTESSGLDAWARGWDVGGHAHVSVNEAGEDTVRLGLDSGSHNRFGEIYFGLFTRADLEALRGRERGLQAAIRNFIDGIEGSRGAEGGGA